MLVLIKSLLVMTFYATVSMAPVHVHDIQAIEMAEPRVQIEIGPAPAELEVAPAPIER